MKILSIIMTCLFLMACGPKSKKSSPSTVPSPSITIDTASLKGITASNIANFMLSGSCLEEDQPVIVRVGGLIPEMDPICTSDGTWVTDMDLTSLSGASREISITVDQWTSDGRVLPQAIGSLLLHPRVTIAANLLDITSTNAASFSVSGTCSEEGQAVTVAAGGVVVASDCSSEAWEATLNMSGLSGPSRTLFITADHLTSGNLAADQATGSALLHPRVSVATDLDGITSTNLSSFEVRGTCSENAETVTVNIGGVSATPSCANLTWVTEIDLSTLTGASRSIDITANHATSDGSLDAVEATGSALLYPRVTVAANLDDITLTNLPSFEVQGTCSENAETVTVNIGGVSATPTCTSLAWSTNINLSSLTGASRNIDITANHATSDGSLNAVEATGSALLHPRVTIATNLSGITSNNLSSFEVQGTCSENAETVTVNIGGVSAAPTCTSLAWSTNINLSSLTGASRNIDITANHATSDGSLNAEEATGSALLHPRVTIAADPVGITPANAASFSVSGTCSEEGQAVTVSVGAVDATSTCATGGTWTSEVDMSGLTGDSGPVAITADHATSGDPPLEATQATGSVIAYISFTIDTLVDITAANAASFRISGSCLEEGRPVTVSVATAINAAPDCTNGVWTTDIDVTGLNKTTGDIEITANHSPESGSAHAEQTETVTNNFTCPTSYVGVPSLSGYTTNSFCVMKYEAKSDESDTDDDDGIDNNNAVSQASGVPYVSINQTDSIIKCVGLNDEDEDNNDLITNDEWQTLARNIELVPGNWATGAVGNVEGLSRGHSDNIPPNALAANSDDNEGCFETEQVCDGSTWDSQRRTHTLSNGEIIWDLSGNVSEWIKDTNDVDYGENSFISVVTATSHSTLGSLTGGTTTTSRTAKDQFGPSGDYSGLDSNPYGNLGWGLFVRLPEHDGGFRGGHWATAHTVGVFAVNLVTDVENIRPATGFRCVYHP